MSLRGGMYQRENDRLRVVYSQSSSRDPKEVQLEVGPDCSLRDAWRVALVREIASSVLVYRWSRGRMTWRKLWKLATEYPFEFDLQLELAEKKKARPKKVT